MLAAEEVVLVEPPAEPLPLALPPEPVEGVDDGGEVFDGVVVVDDGVVVGRVDGVVGAGVVVVVVLDGAVLVGVVVVDVVVDVLRRLIVV